MSGCNQHYGDDGDDDGDDGDDDDGDDDDDIDDDDDLNDHHFIITLASWPPRILPPPLLPHWQLRTPEDIIFAFAIAIVFAIAGSVSLDGNTFPGTRSPLRDKLSFVLLSMLVSSWI